MSLVTLILYKKRILLFIQRIDLAIYNCYYALEPYCKLILRIIEGHNVPY